MTVRASRTRSWTQPVSQLTARPNQLTGLRLAPMAGGQSALPTNRPAEERGGWLSADDAQRELAVAAVLPDEREPQRQQGVDRRRRGRVTDVGRLEPGGAD